MMMMMMMMMCKRGREGRVREKSEKTDGSETMALIPSNRERGARQWH